MKKCPNKLRCDPLVLDNIKLIAEITIFLKLIKDHYLKLKQK